MNWEEWGEHIRKIHKERYQAFCQRGLVKIVETNQTMLLDGWYEIDYEKWEKPMDVWNWIWHLREKDWFTSEIQNDFLYAVELIFGEPRKSKLTPRKKIVPLE